MYKYPLKYDLSAGLVTFLVALPLCLGIALASTGRPDLLFSGIIAGVIGGVVVGFLSGSAVGVSGPAAGLVVIVLNALGTLGSFEAFLVAVILAGLMQLVAGFMHAGIIGYYFPSSVVKGMLAGIGIILILKEIPHALGYEPNYMGDLPIRGEDGLNTFGDLLLAVNLFKPAALFISLLSFAILLLMDSNWAKKIKMLKITPAPLLVVLLGVGINALLSRFFPHIALSREHLVQLPIADNAADFFSFFTFPDFSILRHTDVYVIAFTLAVVASLETLLSVEATDKLDPNRLKTPTNRELKAQGMGNILSGLIGGLPITQVVVRSSANINAGGKTKRSTIFHGLLLLLTAMFIPGFLNKIPLASLAAILILVGYKLSKLSLYMGMYKQGKDQFIPFLITVVTILLTDLLIGIGVGMAFAVFFILRNNLKYSHFLEQDVKKDGTHYTIKLAQEVSFLNKAAIIKALEEIPREAKVTIDGSKSALIDHDVLEAIEEFVKLTAPSRDIQVSTMGLSKNKVIDSV